MCFLSSSSSRPVDLFIASAQLAATFYARDSNVVFCGGLARAFELARRGQPVRSNKKLADERYFGFAYTSALITSMPTKRSLPSTQASCPGGIVYDSPALIVFSLPSFIRTFIRPETA